MKKFMFAPILSLLIFSSLLSSAGLAQTANETDILPNLNYSLSENQVLVAATDSIVGHLAAAQTKISAVLFLLKAAPSASSPSEALAIEQSLINEAARAQVHLIAAQSPNDISYWTGVNYRRAFGADFVNSADFEMESATRDLWGLVNSIINQKDFDKVEKYQQLQIHSEKLNVYYTIYDKTDLALRAQIEKQYAHKEPQDPHE